jgi:hypothetical protein
VGPDLEAGSPSRLAASAEAASEGLVHDGLQPLAGPSNLLAQPLGDVGVQGQGGPHGGIMMPLLTDVKASAGRPM